SAASSSGRESTSVPIRSASRRSTAFVNETGRSGPPRRTRPPALLTRGEHGVRERDGALETGTANELDRLVDRCVAGDTVDERKLIRAEAKRGAHRSVESVDTPTTERLARVVERP